MINIDNGWILHNGEIAYVELMQHEEYIRENPSKFCIDNIEKNELYCYVAYKNGAVKFSSDVQCIYLSGTKEAMIMNFQQIKDIVNDKEIICDLYVDKKLNDYARFYSFWSFRKFICS